MEQQNNIRIFDTALALSKGAGKFIIAQAERAIKDRGRFVLSLSGGQTPEQLYSLLSRSPFREEMPWQKTFIFWGDERCVGLAAEQNNAYRAKNRLLNHVPVPATHIFPIPVNLSPEEAALAYETSLKQFFKEEAPCFDLILLGLGTNGHTASLFPGTAVLQEQSHWVAPVYVTEQHMYRITMTLPLINQARNIAYLVEGLEKAEILNSILNPVPGANPYPAQLIRPVKGHLYWFVDDKALSVFRKKQWMGMGDK